MLTTAAWYYYQGFQEQLKLDLRQLPFQFHSLSQLHSQYQRFEKHWVLELSQPGFQLCTLPQLGSQYQGLEEQLMFEPRQHGFQEQLNFNFTSCLHFIASIMQRKFSAFEIRHIVLVQTRFSTIISAVMTKTCTLPDIKKDWLLITLDFII